MCVCVCVCVCVVRGYKSWVYEKQGKVNACEPNGEGEQGQTEGDVIVGVLEGRKSMIISPFIIWYESLMEPQKPSG